MPSARPRRLHHTPHLLFHSVDGGGGGWLQTQLRMMKFVVRHNIYSAHLHRARAFLTRRRLLHLEVLDPYLLIRLMRTYLWRALHIGQRTDALIAHFRWLSGRYSASAILGFYQSGSHTLYAQDCSAGRLHIDLEPAGSLGREGALELHLKLERLSLMRVAFSILPGSFLGLEDEAPVLVIGCVQGLPSSIERIKTATLAMERTRPQSILLTALQGLASGWHLAGIVGVSNASHVYAGFGALAKRVRQDYDEMWAEAGATRQTPSSHWALPLEWIPRSEQDVPSSKRSQLRKRNELRTKIHDTVAANCLTLGDTAR